MVPRDREGPQLEKTIFTCAYIEKDLLQNQQANFNQTWYKSSLGKGPGPLQRGDNHENAKWGGVIFFSRTTELE
jgi:hypothetical protein